MENVNKSSLSDIPFNEIENDLGTERYVNGLIEFIKKSDAPITIALQGEWGSGKTSLMNRLKRGLCSTPGAPFIDIEVNTWEYSMLSSPEETVFKIIEHLVKKLSGDDQNSKNTLNKWARNFKHMLYRGAREGLKTIPGVGIIIESANVPTDLKDDTPEEITLTDLRESLEYSVANTIQNKKKQGVIVFVDDLDRLNPPVAVEILELLKNIFCIKGCIFVLAIDYEVVVKGLKPKFGELTDKNEREFRSFFDKIIQVPFSLPVNSYRPMNFVLNSLMKIEYISKDEERDVRDSFDDIVRYSVGNNPRSIKRLINTLSLQSCIAKTGEDSNQTFTNSLEGRIVNFAIVALQVCYPKIYEKLTLKPDFTKWDESICSNTPVDNESEETPDWGDVLKKVCDADQYLTQRYNHIYSLLGLIEEKVKDGGDESKFEENIQAIIDKSSVTSIAAPVYTSKVDLKDLIRKLQPKVEERIREKQRDIADIQAKRKTKNGGFYLYYNDNGGRVEVTLCPNTKHNKMISLEVRMATAVPRPERLKGKSFKEMMQDDKVKNAMDGMDECVTRLLQLDFFESTEDKRRKTFNNFSEKQDDLYKDGESSNISQDVSYWILLPSQDRFEEKIVIEAIADVIIAAYNYRLAATKF